MMGSSRPAPNAYQPEPQRQVLLSAINNWALCNTIAGMQGTTRQQYIVPAPGPTMKRISTPRTCTHVAAAAGAGAKLCSLILPPIHQGPAAKASSVATSTMLLYTCAGELC
mmetsp:Transcript_18420/g.39596  ORF Transcript_18420/g.39596 Transcript_18420/m.39596 type:complete len:111 (-) Transcript_18420:845-1177(-)